MPYMWAGAKVYDFIAGNARRLPPSYFLGREEALFQFPMLRGDGLKGAVVYCACTARVSRPHRLSSCTTCDGAASHLMSRPPLV